MRKSCAVPIEGKKGSLFDNIYTVDISRAGIGLVARDEVAINQEIVVEVELQPGQEPVLMLGQVRWARPVSSTGNYRIGIKFIKVLSPGARSRLTDYFGD